MALRQHPISRSFAIVDSPISEEDSENGQMALRQHPIWSSQEDLENGPSAFQQEATPETSQCNENGIPADDELPGKYVFCENCVEYEKITSIDELRAGDHIRFHRILPYYHHSIIIEVTSIDKDNSKRGEITVVHFNKKKIFSIKVFEEKKNIDLSKQTIERIVYRYGKLKPDQIVQNAKQLASKYNAGIRNDTYNVLLNNCEDVANEIACGNNKSFQREKFFRGCFSFFEKLSNFLRPVFEIFVKIVGKCPKLIRGIGFPILAVISIVVKFIYILVQLKLICSKKKHGWLCLDCFQQEKTQLYLQMTYTLLGLAFLTGALLVELPHVWIICGGYVAVTALLELLHKWLYKKINPILHPLALIPKFLVTQGQMIKVGDIITFPYLGFYHEGIVSKADVTHEELPYMAHIEVIHSCSKGIPLLTKRTIKKEEICFNLKDEKVCICDIVKGKVNNDVDVVFRANVNTGTKVRRSKKFALKCKTGRDEVKNNDISLRRVTKREEIKPGDILVFKYGINHEHYAVVVKVRCTEIFQCDVIHYKRPRGFQKNVVAKEQFIFKTKDRNVFVHEYPDEDLVPGQVAALAEGLIGQQKYNIFNHRSEHFVKKCIDILQKEKKAYFASKDRIV